jgi:hypothetical protein
MRGLPIGEVKRKVDSVDMSTTPSTRQDLPTDIHSAVRVCQHFRLLSAVYRTHATV